MLEEGTVSTERILTEAQFAMFRRDGFVVVRKMFDDVEMAHIAAWSDEMESRPEVPGAYMKYFEESLRSPSERILQRLENFYPYHDGFSSLFDGKLRQVSAELFGAEAVLFKDKINFKKPGGDGFKPHQDQQAGWSSYADLFITAMVSIDPATDENGCLELVAGQHGRGLIGAEWVPLDEANIGRFVEMLRAMQSDTQFILVTHNRKTMEIADRLYGVTMEEPGVSKLISVQLA